MCHLINLILRICGSSETAASDCCLACLIRLGLLALVSIGYADQEIYLGLLVAGSVGLAMAIPIALAISGFLAILALSYTRIIQSYPSG
jgi:hypothetical protein